MKNKLLITIIVLFVIIVAMFIAPYLVHHEPVKAAIKNQLAVRFNIRAEIEDISWSWFPGPHIILTRTKLYHDRVKITLAKANVAIDLWSLFSKSIGLKIILNDPDVIVKTLAGPDAKPEEPVPEKESQSSSLPSITVVVKNGHVLLPSDGVLKNFAGNTLPLELSDLDAAVTVTHEMVDIKSTCRTTFADNLDIRIHFTIPGQTSAASTDVSAESIWDMDISGENINLTEAREKVLLLFGESEVAGIVCDIVRGGTAKKGGYVFKGKTSDFSELDAMLITADVETAIVHLSELNLHLEDAGGPVVIKDSVLTGEGLSARIGDIQGRNGTLKLDLGEDGMDFMVGVDVDADLAGLPDLLKGLLGNDVIHVLDKIKSIDGRALCRLSLGDTLDRVNVKVNIIDSDSRITCQWLRHPAGIKKGILEFYNDRIVWENLVGKIGSHQIHESTGMVNWGKDTISLDVKDIDANIYVGPLHGELTSWPELTAKITELVHSMKGVVFIENLKIKGPANDPSKWEYGCNIDVKELDIRSPLLPESVIVGSADIQLSQNHIRISNCITDVYDRQFEIKCDLNHSLWKEFRGTLEVKGTPGNAVAGWIKKKNWIPEAFFPRFPCTLDPLKITLEENATLLNCRILSSKEQEKVITTQIDLNLSGERILLKELTIIAPDEKASFWIHYNKGPGMGINAGFKGSLSKHTLDQMLEENNLLSGKVEGDCSLQYILEKPIENLFQGSLEMSGFRFHLKDDNTIKISQAAIKGRDSQIELENVSLSLNSDLLTTRGRVSLAGNQILTDLKVNSDYISANNLLNIFKSFKKEMSTRNDAPDSKKPEADRITAPYDLISDLTVLGKIDFQIKQFDYTPDKPISTATEIDYTGKYKWKNLSGRINMEAKGKTSVSINTSEICGIETTGVIGIPPARTSVEISTMNNKKIQFEDFFSCAGIKTDKINGLFRLGVDLEGVPGNWENGDVKFSARDGRIKGMTAMTRVLKIVNVTDLFSSGQLKSFFSGGYPYSEIKMTGTIKDNILHINDLMIKGEGMNLYTDGRVDLGKMELDLVVMAAFFKTFDAIVTIIPGVGREVSKDERSVSAMPITIKGPIKDPDVRLFSEDSVTGSILDIFKKTIQFPFRLFSPKETTPDESGENDTESKPVP